MNVYPWSPFSLLLLLSTLPTCSWQLYVISGTGILPPYSWFCSSPFLGRSGLDLHFLAGELTSLAWGPYSLTRWDIVHQRFDAVVECKYIAGSCSNKSWREGRAKLAQIHMLYDPAFSLAHPLKLEEIPDLRHPLHGSRCVLEAESRQPNSSSCWSHIYIRSMVRSVARSA